MSLHPAAPLILARYAMATGQRLTCGGAVVFLAVWWFSSTFAETASPAEFVAVDTSRVTAPAFPFALDDAFPRLQFPGQRLVQVLAVPDGSDRLLAVCQTGQVFVFVDDRQVERTEVFLDLSGEIYPRGIKQNEQHGLLSIAFHPQFVRNGELFACYTRLPSIGWHAWRYDAVTVLLLVLGAALGAQFRVPRKLLPIWSVLLSIGFALAVAVIVVPWDGLSTLQKRWLAIAVFASLLAVLLCICRVCLLSPSRAARFSRVVGIVNGLLFASIASMVLTMIASISVDRSRASILTSKTVELQTSVVGQMLRVLPAGSRTIFNFGWTPRTELVISRLRVSPDEPHQADLSTQQVLMAVSFPTVHHTGGAMEFGADGYLYIGLGDGTSFFERPSQDLTSLHGSILRIDVDRQDRGKMYSIPTDNPFTATTFRGKAHGEIWAYGFRNVWRLGVDGTTGRIWAADVGHYRFEEVNIVKKGGNYGWNEREGFHPFALGEFDLDGEPEPSAEPNRYIDPVIQYDRREGWSVIGGRVYRGRRYPELDGAYLYGDFATGVIWAAKHDGAQLVENRKIASTGVGISGFGEDQDSEILVCTLGGTIYRLERLEEYRDESQETFPRLLSQTRLFESVAQLTPVPGMIPYDVNLPLWSDDADKQRFIALPAKGKVDFHPAESWQFPLGTVLVKTFLLPSPDPDDPPRRMETRLLVYDPSGWNGYTYVWNDDQLDAHLIDQPSSKEVSVHADDAIVKRQWTFLSRSECNLCHSRANRFVLGLNTRQMNREYDYGNTRANQLDMLERLGVFRETLPADYELPAFPNWNSDAVAKEELARAYLSVNCATCHSPHGIRQEFDARFSTPLAKSMLVGRAPSPPRSREGQAAALITPGRPAKSEILRRIRAENVDRMPPVSSNYPDVMAARVIEQWIAEMGH